MRGRIVVWVVAVFFLIISPFTSASSMRPYLVGEWRFDGGFGTTAYDSSGNGNHGSFGGNPQWTFAGKQGKALVFDGSGDYVDAGDDTSLDITDEVMIRKRNIYIQEIQNIHKGEYYEYIAY